jgi:hypothetical protein
MSEYESREIFILVFAAFRDQDKEAENACTSLPETTGDPVA